MTNYKDMKDVVCHVYHDKDMTDVVCRVYHDKDIKDVVCRVNTNAFGVSLCSAVTILYCSSKTALMVRING